MFATNATAACRSMIASSQSGIGDKHKVSIRSRTCLKVLPVEVENERNGLKREVLAFLDGGADCHLIRRDLYNELGLKAEPVQSRIKLADGTVSIKDAFVTNLLVRGVSNSASSGTYELKSVVVEEALADVSASAPCSGGLERNPHLEDVDIPFIEREHVDIIIGLNARVLHEIHEKREAGPDELCAGRSSLGWFLYGNNLTVDSENENLRPKHACFATSLLPSPTICTKNKPQMSLPKDDSCSVCFGSSNCEECQGTGSRWKKRDSDHRQLSLNDDPAQAILDQTLLTWMGIIKLACYGHLTSLRFLTTMLWLKLD